MITLVADPEDLDISQELDEMGAPSDTPVIIKREIWAAGDTEQHAGSTGDGSLKQVGVRRLLRSLERALMGNRAPEGAGCLDYTLVPGGDMHAAGVGASGVRSAGALNAEEAARVLP